MSILVVGSVVYDDLETPAGKRLNVLGGAATHFSVAASFFSPVSLVGVVGGDFADDHVAFLKARGVDLSGLEVVPSGRTFRWVGHYLNDINKAETIDTQLGVFATFSPKLGSQHREHPYLFLANIHPRLQLEVLSQMHRPRLVAIDTMNYWITTERDALQKVIERADLVFVNEGEARQLTGENNVILAARCLRSWGPTTVVIKRGEYGALLFSGDEIFSAPGLPLATVVDPTGAGDSFAGGFVGHLARANHIDQTVLRQAAICGSCMASFHVEDFGPNRVKTLTQDDIANRYRRFQELTHFKDI